MSPAQASQASGATSLIALCTERVMVSPPSFIAGACSADLEDGFDLDRDAAGQAARPDRGAGMAAAIAKHCDHQVGGAVDHLRHVGELRGAVDKPADSQAAAHAVEIAAAGDPQMRQDVERAEPRCLPPVGDADSGAELPDKAKLAIPLADLTRDEDEIAGNRERNVIRHRRCRLRQFDAELVEPRLDLSAHRLPLHRLDPTRLRRCGAPRNDKPSRYPACRETAAFAL